MLHQFTPTYMYKDQGVRDTGHLKSKKPWWSAASVENNLLFVASIMQLTCIWNQSKIVFNLLIIVWFHFSIVGHASVPTRLPAGEEIEASPWVLHQAAEFQHGGRAGVCARDVGYHLFDLPTGMIIIGCVLKTLTRIRDEFRLGGLKSLARIFFPIACTKIKLFCPNITWFFARKWLFEKF